MKSRRNYKKRSSRGGFSLFGSDNVAEERPIEKVPIVAEERPIEEVPIVASNGPSIAEDSMPEKEMEEETQAAAAVEPEAPVAAAADANKEEKPWWKVWGGKKSRHGRSRKSHRKTHRKSRKSRRKTHRK